MESKHMSQQVFAQAIDMSPASLSSIFNGRTKPTLNIVEAIKRKFPNISVDWLMFGIGEMYSSAEGVEASKEPSSAEPEEPLIDFDSAAASAATSVKSDVAVDQRRTRAAHQQLRDVEMLDMKIADIHKRKVLEIRVYYDDSTFETFVPADK